MGTTPFRLNIGGRKTPKPTLAQSLKIRLLINIIALITNTKTPIRLDFLGIVLRKCLSIIC